MCLLCLCILSLCYYPVVIYFFVFHAILKDNFTWRMAILVRSSSSTITSYHSCQKLLSTLRNLPLEDLPPFPASSPNAQNPLLPLTPQFLSTHIPPSTQLSHTSSLPLLPNIPIPLSHASLSPKSRTTFLSRESEQDFFITSKSPRKLHKRLYIFFYVHETTLNLFWYIYFLGKVLNVCFARVDFFF